MEGILRWPHLGNSGHFGEAGLQHFPVTFKHGPMGGILREIGELLGVRAHVVEFFRLAAAIGNVGPSRGTDKMVAIPPQAIDVIVYRIIRLVQDPRERLALDMIRNAETGQFDRSAGGIIRANIRAVVGGILSDFMEVDSVMGRLYRNARGIIRAIVGGVLGGVVGTILVALEVI